MASCFFNERFPCPMCRRLHAIRDCTRFLVLEPSSRREKAVELKLCTSCLAQTHERRDCPNASSCRLCRSQHNTLLHPRGPNTAWLSMTAMARLYPDNAGWCKLIRLKIDPNVARSCITLDAAEEYHCRINKGYTVVTLKHRLFERDPVDIRCAVVDTRFGPTPRHRVDTMWTLHHPVVGNAHLADQNWFTPYPYKLLLGADALGAVLKGAAITPPGQCAIQFSIFGPVFFGEGHRELEPPTDEELAQLEEQQ